MFSLGCDLINDVMLLGLLHHNMELDENIRNLSGKLWYLNHVNWIELGYYVLCKYVLSLISSVYYIELDYINNLVEHLKKKKKTSYNEH